MKLCKMKITASKKISYKVFYVDNYGSGTSMDEIIDQAEKLNLPNYYWATDSPNYSGMYNGDTVVIYDDINELPLNMQEDAENYGKNIFDSFDA